MTCNTPITVKPYQVRKGSSAGTHEVVDTRTGRIAHAFKFHVEAESCKDCMNEWAAWEEKVQKQRFKSS